MAAMSATSKLFILRPSLSLSLSSLSLPKPKITKPPKKKIPSLDDHLKRRTRSPTHFDPSLLSSFSSHVPVMLPEVLSVFSTPSLSSFLDCTLGAGGHSAAVLRAHPELKLLFGIDLDPDALAAGKAAVEMAALGGTGTRICMQVGNFKDAKKMVREVEEGRLVDGILMDLGMSSMQVNRSEKGFSVMGDGPLDMRMSPQVCLTAADILNSWPEDEIARILRDYGEESNWRNLQRKILQARTSGGLHSTSELVQIIKSASSKSAGRQGWIKTATRVFQALRIAVNDELQTLEDALYACFDILSPGGRLAVISFHSLEDRIVKRTFLDLIKGKEDDTYGNPIIQSDENIPEGELWSKHRVRGKYGTVLTKRPITPSEEEEKINRRCRSAKLRVIQKA